MDITGVHTVGKYSTTGFRYMVLHCYMYSVHSSFVTADRPTFSACFASTTHYVLVKSTGKKFLYILLFLESLADSLTLLQELLRAFGDARGLLGGQAGGGEVVDTVIEAPRHQVGVQAHEVLHLLLLHDLLEFLLFLDVQLVHFEVVGGLPLKCNCSQKLFKVCARLRTLVVGSMDTWGKKTLDMRRCPGKRFHWERH